MTQPHTFAVGDIVYLKSGSPRMVVESMGNAPPTSAQQLAAQCPAVAVGDLRVNVVWSVYETNEIRRDSFPPEILGIRK